MVPRLFSDRLLLIAALNHLGIWPTKLLVLWMTIDPTMANILVIQEFEKELIAHFGLQPKLVDGERITSTAGFICMNSDDGSGAITL